MSQHYKDREYVGGGPKPENPKDKFVKSQLEKSLDTVPPMEIDPGSSEDLALREAIWNNIKELGIDESGLDLTVVNGVTPGQLEETDHARLARLAYGMGYLRILEFLARKPPNWSGNMEQAKLAFAYVKHVETNERDVLKLNRRTQGDQHLDRALNQMQHEVVRIAMIKERIMRRGPVEDE
jgi:hypothetical protein